MTSKAMQRALIVYRVGFGLTLSGLIGLVVCRIVCEIRGISEETFMRSTSGAASVWFFPGMFVAGLFIVIPISILMRRRALGPGPRGRATPAGLLHFAIGRGDPDSELPGWVGWPLWTITTAGSVFLIYVLIIFALRGE